jgi:hypothetical protein
MKVSPAMARRLARSGSAAMEGMCLAAAAMSGSARPDARDRDIRWPAHFIYERLIYERGDKDWKAACGRPCVGPKRGT